MLAASQTRFFFMCPFLICNCFYSNNSDYCSMEDATHNQRLIINGCLNFSKQGKCILVCMVKPTVRTSVYNIYRMRLWRKHLPHIFGVRGLSSFSAVCVWSLYMFFLCFGSFLLVLRFPPPAQRQIVTASYVVCTGTRSPLPCGPGPLGQAPHTL